MRKFLACAVLVSASGCFEVDVDPGETATNLPAVDGPTVEFDPANSIIPFPNDLLIDPATGLVNIPPGPCETPTQAALRTGTLNTLNGFGTYEAAMQVTFTQPVDPSSLPGNIVMIQRLNGATSVTPVVIPTVSTAAQTVRFKEGACDAPLAIDSATIVPLAVLDQKSTYSVAVLSGLRTADGKPYLPSATFALVRQAVNPVTVDANGNIIANRTPLNPTGDFNGNGIPDRVELLGLNQLWNALAPEMAFLASMGISRNDVLVAWEVTTQTTTDQLNQSVAGSPANTDSLTPAPLVGLQSVTCDFDPTTCPRGISRTQPPFVLCPTVGPAADNNTQCFLKIALGNAAGATGAAIYATGNALCAQVGCAAIADVLGGGLVSTNYQTGLPNPLPSGALIPGPWTNPISPIAQNDAVLQVLIFIPTAPGPRPTVVFGHGLTSSKEALFAFAPQLAASPAHFASLAIDFVDHGSRAIQITDAAALNCNGTPNPTVQPQCFQPIITADLAQTRDNIRQTVLDLQRTVLTAKQCGTSGCQSLNSASLLQVDPDHVVYTGQSLGGIIGTTASATSPTVKSAVLNVSGVGLVDILEHTNTLEIKCALVDALIDAQVVVGDKWNGLDFGATGLCTTDAWKSQPGYLQFSQIARWVVDPADPANFMAMLVPAKPWLLQEVVDDLVVPNFATNNQGLLGGLAPMLADGFVPGDPASAAITSNVRSSKWVRYPTLPASDPSTAGFGNLFAHASLLRPSTGIAHCVIQSATVCASDADCPMEEDACLFAPSAGHCTNNPAATCGSSSDCGVGGSCLFPGTLGTGRLQVDAITFINLNL